MPLIRLNSGTEKDVSDRDAKILLALKKAVLVEPSPEQEPEDEPQAEKAKRAYKRKDMQAGA